MYNNTIKNEERLTVVRVMMIIVIAGTVAYRAERRAHTSYIAP